MILCKAFAGACSVTQLSARALLLSLLVCLPLAHVSAEDVPMRLAVPPKEVVPITSLSERRKLVKQEGQDQVDSKSGLYVPFGVHIGTLGWGGFVGLGLTPYLSARLIISQFDYTSNQAIQFGTSALPGQLKLELGFQAFVVDYHPFGGAFYISVGLVNNNTNVIVNAVADRNQSLSFGNQTFTQGVSGNLHGRITPKNKQAAYYGIGFGNYGGGSPFTFALDLGIVAQGDFKATVSHSGFPAAVQDDLDAEVQNAENQLNNSGDLSLLKQHPVIQMFFAYRFDF